MNCKRCGKLLTGKQVSYCSLRCSKLHLKSLYRKRNRDKINAYNRRIRKMGTRICGKDLIKKYIHLRINECYICGNSNNLTVHHIKPRRNGGTNENFNLMLLCKKCHYNFEEATKHLWKRIPKYKIEIEKEGWQGGTPKI